MDASKVQQDYIPKEWEDDVVMDVMFSPFRENRDVNPASWDKKMQFWSEVVHKMCACSQQPVFDANSLPQKFERKGKVPVCLDVILKDNIRRGSLQTVTDFKASVGAGWVSGGWGIFVHKPVTWAWGKVFKSSNSSPIHGQLLHLQVLKEIADKLYNHYISQVKNDLTDRTADMLQLHDMMKDVCPDMETLHLTIMKLCKDKKAIVVETEKNETVVRFAKSTKRSVTPVSDIELQIMRARKVEGHLQIQITQLAEDMKRCRTDAKFYLQQGMKTSAKNALRRKKTMETLLEKREAALENIRHMLTQIQDAHSSKMILDAYSECSRAFKSTAKNYGLTTDNIDDVMTDVQEVFDMNEEINAALAQGPSDPILDLSSSELEAELDSLIAGGELPSAPQDDLLADLEKLKISSEDTLPDVPEFDPATLPAGTAVSPVSGSPGSFTHSPQSVFKSPKHTNIEKEAEKISA